MPGALPGSRPAPPLLTGKGMCVCVCVCVCVNTCIGWGLYTYMHVSCTRGKMHCTCFFTSQPHILQGFVRVSATGC